MVSKVNLWKIGASTQIATASLSFIASCAVAIIMMRNPNGEGRLNTPQRRIFFGLFTSHIVQNLGLITGPFAGKQSPLARWAKGNDLTCTANGILIMAPQPALYSSFLAMFYVCKIRFNMADAKFGNTFEWVIHILIQVYGLSVIIAAFVTNSINTAASGTACMNAAIPTGCRVRPDLVGECDPVVERTTTHFRSVNSAVILFSFFVTTMSLIWISLHSYRVLKTPSPSREARIDSSSNSGSSDTTQNNAAHNRNSSSNSGSSAHNRNTVEKWDDLKKDTVKQAASFIATYLLVNTPLITYRFIYKKNSTGSALLSIVPSVYPLHGFLNLFVYTQPQVASLRRIHPSYSWLRAFRLVLLAGGEIPKDRNKIRENSSFDDNELGRFVNGEWAVSSYSGLTSTNGAVGGCDSHFDPFRDRTLDNISENPISGSVVITGASSPAPEETKFDAKVHNQQSPGSLGDSAHKLTNFVLLQNLFDSLFPRQSLTVLQWQHSLIL